MRVECYTIDEFLISLNEAKSIFEGVVRFSILERPLDDNKREAVRFEIIVQASAVVEGPDYQYILEAGEKCGLDYRDASQEYEGSKKAETYKKAVEDFAGTRGWKVLPGMILP